MSTEENKALERRIIEEVVNKRKLALVDELFATDYVQHAAGEMEARGREGIKQFFTTFVNVFPDIYITIDDMVAERDKVVTRATFRGTHRRDFMGIAPTGKQVTFTGIVISRVAGGREAEAWLVTDQLGVMQQIGAVPS